MDSMDHSMHNHSHHMMHNEAVTSAGDMTSHDHHHHMHHDMNDSSGADHSQHEHDHSQHSGDSHSMMVRRTVISLPSNDDDLLLDN